MPATHVKSRRHLWLRQIHNNFIFPFSIVNSLFCPTHPNSIFFNIANNNITHINYFSVGICYSLFIKNIFNVKNHGFNTLAFVEIPQRHTLVFSVQIGKTGHNRNNF